jgi:hypothetical protein
MIALLLATTLTATPAAEAAVQSAPEAATATRGVAGVCIRWSRPNSTRVGEAVIVQASMRTAANGSASGWPWAAPPRRRRPRPCPTARASAIAAGRPRLLRQAEPYGEFTYLSVF